MKHSALLSIILLNEGVSPPLKTWQPSSDYLKADTKAELGGVLNILRSKNLIKNVYSLP